MSDEERARLDEAFVLGPAGTMAPRAWSGLRSGAEAEGTRRKFGEEEVSDPLTSRLDSCCI